MAERAYESAFIEVLGVRTHYLEAGSGPDLILLHSGEYGASAELSWRNNISALAENFHVLAPDLPGFGDSDKVYSFSERTGFRVRHLTRFCEQLSVEKAHFVGSSFSGGLLLNTASDPNCPLPIDRLVSVCGGGDSAKDPTARQALTGYDGTPDSMRKVLQALFLDEEWWSDERIAEKQESALKPGAWEAASAPRLMLPGKSFTTQFTPADFSLIKSPTLIIACLHDLIKEPNWGPEISAQVPGSELYTFEKSRHMPHIESPAEFNELVSSFLLRG